MIHVSLTEEQLRAVLKVVAVQVDANEAEDRQDMALDQAEFELDSALLEHEIHD